MSLRGVPEERFRTCRRKVPEGDFWKWVMSWNRARTEVVVYVRKVERHHKISSKGIPEDRYRRCRRGVPE
jgi:hypothetical protein